MTPIVDEVCECCGGPGWVEIVESDVELPVGAVMIESCGNCSYASDETAAKFAVQKYPGYRVGLLEIKGFNLGQWLLLPPRNQQVRRVSSVELLARDLLARLSRDYGDSEDCPAEVLALFNRGEKLLPVSDKN